MYISVVSAAHRTAAKGKWVAVVASVVETAEPHSELRFALGMLGKIDAQCAPPPPPPLAALAWCRERSKALREAGE